MNNINATDTSFDDETIVTGDDFGLVKLFRFPSLKKGNHSMWSDVKGSSKSPHKYSWLFLALLLSGGAL